MTLQGALFSATSPLREGVKSYGNLPLDFSKWTQTLIMKEENTILKFECTIKVTDIIWDINKKNRLSEAGLNRL
jgi:hypothetical protein